MQRATDPKYDIRRNMRTYSLPHGNRGAMRNQPVAGAGKFFSFFLLHVFLFCLFSGTHFLSSWPSVEVRAGAFRSDAACHARGYGSKSVGRCRITVRGFPRFATASATAGFSLANCAFLSFFISPLTCRRCKQIAQVAANSVDDVRSERTKKNKNKRGNAFGARLRNDPSRESSSYCRAPSMRCGGANRMIRRQRLCV